MSSFVALKKLLLEKGPNYSVQTHKLIAFYFYKNLLLLFCELGFQLDCGFSGEDFFIDYQKVLYNVLFTSFQCLVAIAFEIAIKTPLKHQ